MKKSRGKWKDEEREKEKLRKEGKENIGEVRGSKKENGENKKEETAWKRWNRW